MGNYLITGACGGMGSALCRALASAGDRVWGLDLTDSSSAPFCRLISADLCSQEAVEAAAETVGREAGELNGIIHMAGVYDLDSLAEMSGMMRL